MIGDPLSGSWEPAYLEAWRSGALDQKAAAAREELRHCRACPRDCGVDRFAGETGTCRVGRHALVASAFPHHGEEDCLRGRGGSGTIFFAGCNLRCVFCQNWDISQRDSGAACPPEDLAGLMLALQDRGCHNINLVTPEHVAPQIAEALALAVPGGLRLPLVYNTGAYDGPASLHLMAGLVDMYMPDFKFWEPATARRLAATADYPERAREAIAEMHRQVGVLRLGPDGLARRGVLVRHLVMPGLGAETAAILSWLARTLSIDTYVNLMAQYRPDHRVPAEARFAAVDRRPLPE
ncbi:MAG: radical SAM protein, partial [Actinobacteria bacterium]|nr:radical SAM protein [Actinomycetota bacterium]